MLEGDSEGIDQVNGTEFTQQVLLGIFGMFRVVALDNVQPDDTGQISRRQGELRPVFAAIVVSLVGGGDAEGETECNDETQNSEQHCVDTWSIALARRINA